MDDFNFLDELDDEEDMEFNDLPLDDEFIRDHFSNVPESVIENFPFVEDDVDAITDYELFSKGFGYLDDKKADKEELADYAKKSDIPDVSEYVKKDTTELENYTKTSDLSEVALTGDYDDLLNKPELFSGDYNDLTNKPTIPVVPTNISAFNNDSGYITKNVNDLTNYTLTSNLASVATSGSYNDLSNTPTIPDVSNFITKDVNNLTYYTLTSNLSTVATTGSYNDLSNKPTIPTVPTNISAFNNDSGYITKNVNDLTNYTLTSNLASVATSGSYNDLSNKPTIPPTMTILSYGNSSWNDFITAYNSNTIVYCRASSNSNPATGSQTRLAFMAYVNNETTPTEVEFQYYRSVNTHSDSQQGDQVFVYKLTSAGTWTVTNRNTFSKVVAGTNLSSSYNNGTITLNNTLTVPTQTSDLTNDSNFISATDVGWTSLNNYVKYCRKSNIVFVEILCDDGSHVIQGTDYIANLPEGFRPSTRIDFNYHKLSGSDPSSYAYINPNGVMVLGNDGNNAISWFGGSVSFPI